LNDLHRASGGEAKHQPALFVRLDQTQALIKEISSTDLQSIPIGTVLGKGKQQGTFVAKELIYAYAMWISPKFSLMVIRAFDALVTGQRPEIGLGVPYVVEKKADFLEMSQSGALFALILIVSVCYRRLSHVKGGKSCQRNANRNRRQWT
jgi:hypothetical protein